MRDAFSRALYQVAQKTPKVFIVVADISPAASMEPFRKQFPDRFYNVGVSEQAMISICTGLALRGCRPFAYTIAPFAIYRPFEHIRVELCYQNLPVTVVGVGAGLSYSVAGATHNAIEDIGVMTALPNLSILAPCDPLEVFGAVEACVNSDGPVYLRLGKAGEPNLTENAKEPFIFGKIRKIADGRDVAVIGYGPILHLAFQAAEQLAGPNGVRPAIFSAHTLKPLDEARVRSLLKEYRKVVVLEECTGFGSLGSRIKTIAWDLKADCRICLLHLQDKFIKCYGTKDQLLSAHGIDVERVKNALRD